MEWGSKVFSFRLGAAFSGAAESYLRGITEIRRVTTGGQSYLLTNSGPGGGVMALRLTGASSGHGLQLVDQMALSSSYRSGPDAGLEMVTIDGQLRVTTLGPTVSAVSATALSSAGVLGGSLTLSGLPANRADLSFLDHSSGLLCFAATTDSADIVIYRASDTGQFSAIGRFTLPQGDSAGADDLRLEQSTTADGTQMLLAATASGDAVLALQIGADGSLT